MKRNYCFEEEVISYCEKIIYLDYERFLHIYARHVRETQMGGKFAVKTIFRYQFDDIMHLIKAVLDVAHNDIQQHF